MEKFEANKLMTKFKAGTCSAEELEVINCWLHYFRSRTAVKYTSNNLEHISDELWAKIDAHTSVKKEVRITLWPRIATVAAVLLFVFGSIYVFQTRIHHPKETASIYKNDVDPGRNKAFLVLADGKKVGLNHLQANALAQPGVTITRSGDGMLIYKMSANRGVTNQTNTLETPNGGRFQLLLPDGTKVWLNAASSLNYPLSFENKKERMVELKGEGYFEVAHDKLHPFLVRSGTQTVQVLGTHFNIQAYSNEKHIRTTLISGSVKISSNTGNGSKILKPGEQSDFISNNIKVSIADSEQATAWVTDDFVFNGEDLHAVMRQIARWYDVEVVYDGEKDTAAFYSTISRKKKLSEILKALTLNQGVHFKLEGRRVTVMP